jgi:hypothetical protein
MSNFTSSFTTSIAKQRKTNLARGRSERPRRLSGARPLFFSFF